MAGWLQCRGDAALLMLAGADPGASAAALRRADSPSADTISSWRRLIRAKCTRRAFLAPASRGRWRRSSPNARSLSLGGAMRTHRHKRSGAYAYSGCICCWPRAVLSTWGGRRRTDGVGRIRRRHTRSRALPPRSENQAAWVAPPPRPLAGFGRCPAPMPGLVLLTIIEPTPNGVTATI